MTHHELIWDPNMVREFDEVLNVDLGRDRVRVTVLLARAKYLSQEDSKLVSHAHLKNLHLTRRLVRQRGDLLQTLRHYEVPLDAFTCTSKDGQTHVPVPPGCTALYLTVRARSCLLAYKNFQAAMTSLCIEALSNGDSKLAMEAMTRVESEFKGAVHRAVSLDAPHMLDFDVDTKDPALLESLGQLLFDCGAEDKLLAIVETRGGFHVLVNKTTVADVLPRIHEFCRNSVFADKDRNGKSISKHWVSISGDGMVPVPGTLQGGFRVKMLPKEFRFRSLPSE